jgi:hypothetical protein
LFANYKGTPATILHDDCPVNRTGSKKYNFEITEEAELTHSHVGMLYPNWIITDCRFPNEFAAVKERGGLCVKVERYDKADTRKFNEVPNWNHPSETALDSHKFDYVLANHGTVEELVVEVQNMLKHFKLIPDGTNS